MKKIQNNSLAPKDKELVALADIFHLYGDDYRRSRAVSYDATSQIH